MEDLIDAADDLVNTLQRILGEAGAREDLRDAIGVYDLDELEQRIESVKQALEGH